MRQRKEKQITVKGHVFILFHNLELVDMKDRRSSCTVVFDPLFSLWISISLLLLMTETQTPLREQPNVRTCTGVIGSSVRAKLGLQKLLLYRDNNTTHGCV